MGKFKQGDTGSLKFMHFSEGFLMKWLIIQNHFLIINCDKKKWQDE